MERDREDILTLGRRLADSVGFRVIALDGRELGVLDHVRYKKHADHPDEIVVRKRRLLWDRTSTIAFEEISAVDPVAGRVYLSVPSTALQRE
jgi:hypothetical protein